MRIQIPHNTSLIVRFVSVIFLTMAMLVPSLDAQAEPKRKKNDSRGNSKPFVVVIDAGHGGHDHGAIDNGAREKDINLGVAKKLAADIKKKMKNVKVVMTRDDDTFISLQERANIANRNKGDLFISIHTNSVDKKNPNRKTVSGTSVYALGPQKDANNLQVARRENSVIELEDNYHQKYSGFDPSKDESYIIFEMAQKKNLGQSLRFAEKAQKALVNTAGRKDRGVKQAGFWVLWATAMPAVLVELDFICNPTEAKFINSDAGQTKLADALFKAVESYVASVHKPIASSAHDSQTQPSPTTQLANNQVEEPTDEEKDPVTTSVAVVASNNTKRAPRTHVNETHQQNKGTLTSRRRRSDSARKLSDSRSFETEAIALKSEGSYLAKTDVKKETVQQESEQSDDSKVKTKDKKKGKKKNTKEKKPKKLDSKKKGANSGRKTFVVKTDGDKSLLSANSGGGSSNDKNLVKTGAQRASRKVESRKKGALSHYTIVLLSSNKELKSDDPAFCKLVPTGYFMENGKYNYTYGSSENRKEIEQRLLQIKSIIPEASIVVRME